MHGARGGHCRAQGAVSTRTMGFDAGLRLHDGDATDACLRGGGHGLDWVCIDDPDAGTGCPVPAELPHACRRAAAGYRRRSAASFVMRRST